jgi:outer membrane protein TolC
MEKHKKYHNRWLISMVTMCLLVTAALSHAQSGKTLTIGECYTLAKNNYPLVKQMELIDKTRDYTIENISKGYLPQVNVYGQATYQSAVTQLPKTLPGGPLISKDQYKIYTEVYQPVTEGRTIKEQKGLAVAHAAAEQQKIEVELYQLKDRINQLFFGILLIDAQIQQSELLKKDIRAGIDKTNAAIANGTALKSNADLLQAELLKADQHTIELQANRKAFTDMLSEFIKQPVDKDTKLLVPLAQPSTAPINRPELRLYELQKKSYDAQSKLITAGNLPRAGFFIQGGAGRPGLNMLKNDLTAYYIGGFRLSWNITGFYTAKREREILKISQASLDVQKETFLLNTNLSLSQQNSEVAKYNELARSDNDIIALREKIKQVSKSQLENGTITTNDYLTYVNAEDQARQSLLLHQVQLLLAQFNYQTTSGN